MATRERVGTGGALVPYSRRRAFAGALEDPRATAGYYSQAGTNAASRAQSFLNKYGASLAGGAAALGGIGTAIDELQAGRPVGAAGAALGGIGAGALTYGGTKLLGKGVPGTIAGLGLMGLGALLPQGAAQAAEYGRQKVTGIPATGKEGTVEAQLDFLKKRGITELDLYGRQMNIDTSAVKDLSQFYSNQAYTDLQRNIPLINKLKDAELVRNQALMASRGNQLARLSVLGTAGDLATGGQAETGATVRTMIQSNPYAAATVF